MTLPSTEQLKQALIIRQELDSLEKALEAILGGSGRGGKANGSGGMSAAGRAKIAAAQRERWAKTKAQGGAKPKRTMPASAKAKLAAIARRRWKAAKAAGKKAL